ncbi:MAG: molybdenum cofactor guanylyltransferase MobA [Rhizobiaceae bacterium]|nr:molybdenum cofactor guanylyltransferase MobA [Rhizobiaceae bacterium]
MNQIEKTSIIGGILAGGLSRRMNGLEKSLIKLDGIPLIKRAALRLKPQVANLVINANGDPTRFSSLGFEVVADIIEGYAGPLAGIHSLLSFIEQTSPEITHVATVAADTPFFPEDFVKKCIEQIQDHDEKTKIVLATSNQNRHPVFGLWPVALLQPLTDFLEREQTRKVMAFVNMHPHSFVDFSHEAGDNSHFDPFFNINSPDDLTTAQTYCTTQVA